MLEEPLPTVKIEPPFQENAASVANALVDEAYTTPFAVNDVKPVPPLVVANVPAKVTAPVVAVFGVKPVVPALNEDTLTVDVTFATSPVTVL